MSLDIPWQVRLHQGLGRGGFEAKFRKLMASFPTATAIEVAEGRAWPEYRLALG